MNNEIRNELLLILDMVKAKDGKERNFKLDWLLERFQNDIERQLEDLKHKQQELEENLKTLDYVKQEIYK